MSQHRTMAYYRGKLVSVLAGWDRPMRRYFLHVEELGEEDAETIFSSLDDEPDHGYASADGIRARLADLDIGVVDEMISEIAADGDANVGNKIKDWETL